MTNPAPNLSGKSAEVDLTGRQLAGYQLIRRLGRGGMAEVWLAEQSALRRQVALKLLKADLAGDDTYIQRFRIEAQAAAALIHPNIVQIYDVGQVDGLHFIAQEYVPGQNLREYLVRHGPPDLQLALSVMRQVTAALHKAAEHGIVHRDIKPENIMLAHTGDVKVADFGLARLTGTGEQLNLTQVGMTMGTPLYMSPEQVEGKQLDPRSDIYSLGVTCYHMLAGHPPFTGETALSVAVQHLKSRPDPLETLRPDLPPALCRLVHKMLAKDREGRYATPREVLLDLRTLAASEALADQPAVREELANIDASMPVVPTHAATHRLAEAMHTQALLLPRRSRRWLIGVFGLAIMLCAGLLLARVLRPTPLLKDTPTFTSVAAKEDSRSQYFEAMRLDTEGAWQAVWELHPETGYSDYYARRARQQLARLYLERGDTAAAAKLFDEFASLADNDATWRAYGLAGQALMLLESGDPDAAKLKADHARREAGTTPDPATAMLLERVDPRITRPPGPPSPFAGPR